MAENRCQKYDVLRGLAIVFVLLIHTSAEYGLLSAGCAARFPLDAANKLFNSAVPTFVTLTVFLALRGGKRRGPSYVIKKALPLLAMYAAWSAVYAALRMTVGGEALPSAKAFALDWLLQGRTFYHLYYIILLLQLYVVIALLSRVKRPRSPWLAPLAAAAQVAVTLFIERAARAAGFTANLGVLAVYYLTSTAYGLYLASGPKAEERMGRPWPLYAAGLAVMCLVRAALADGLGPAEGTLAGDLTAAVCRELFILAAVPTMLRLADALASCRPLAVLGRHSLGIYFAHPMLIYIAEPFLGGSGDAATLAGMAVKLALVTLFALVFAYGSEARFLRSDKNAV